MLQIQIQSNAKKVDSALIFLDAQLRNYSVPLAQVGEYMVKSVQSNFLEQGRPTPWLPLSPMTLARRKKGTSGGSPKILMDRGFLFKSITRSEPTETEVKVGTNISYGKLHQFGGISRISAHKETVGKHYRNTKSGRVKVKEFTRDVKAKSYKIPARPFLLFQPEDTVAINKIITMYIQGSKKKAIDESK